MIEFPNSPATYRPFWERLASLHKSIKHDPQNGINRFWEMSYLDFPYDDWDLAEYESKKVSGLGLNIEKYPNAQAMGILSFETQTAPNKNNLMVPASLFFVQSCPDKQAADTRIAARTAVYEATYKTALSFRGLLRKYFQNTSQFGTLIFDSFQTIHIQMPKSGNPVLGTRLDFKYEIFLPSQYNADDWEIDVVPTLTIPA